MSASDMTSQFALDMNGFQRLHSNDDEEHA